jgi:pimeloyl-ACP methyl ester carboxylesterase
MVSVFKSEKGKEQVLKSYNDLLKQWDTDIQEIDLQTKYGTTHCINAGNKENPPLLMFHGVGDNSAVMWVLNIKELSRHFYCIAVDTLGGPGKSVPNENYNKKSFSQVDWINEVVELLQLGRFHIIGVSNGACMAYNYTTREKQKIDKVLCLEGGMITNPIKAIVMTLGKMFPEILIPTRKNMIRIMKKFSSPYSEIYTKHPEIVDHLVQVMKNHNQGAMFMHKVEKYDKKSGTVVREKLYFLIGGHMLEDRKEFIDILEDGGFQYKVIKDAGHGINHDQPEIVNNEIIQFLSGKEVKV